MIPEHFVHPCMCLYALDIEGEIRGMWCISTFTRVMRNVANGEACVCDGSADDVPSILKINLLVSVLFC